MATKKSAESSNDIDEIASIKPGEDGGSRRDMAVDASDVGYATAVGDANEQPVVPTKMSKASDVYRRMSRKKGTTRKEIVAAFIEEVGLSKAGAATYYQTIKKSKR